MMNRPRLNWLSVLLALLPVLAWACTAEVTPADTPEGGSSFNEEALWRDLPLPDDAEIVPVGEGIDLGFATRMVEPELFDFYAAWLREQGWRQQAPTEAMVTLPHQVWRKEEAELVIEIQGLDEEGNTVVWMTLVMDDAP